MKSEEINKLKAAVCYSVSKQLEMLHFEGVEKLFIVPKTCPSIKKLFDLLQAADAPEEEYKLRDNGCDIFISSKGAEVVVSPSLVLDMETANFFTPGSKDFIYYDYLSLHDTFNRNIPNVNKEDIMIKYIELYWGYFCPRTGSGGATPFPSMEYEKGDTIYRYIFDGNTVSSCVIMDETGLTPECTFAEQKAIRNKLGDVFEDVDESYLKERLEKKGVKTTGHYLEDTLNYMKSVVNEIQSVIDKCATQIVLNTAERIVFAKGDMEFIREARNGPLFQSDIEKIKEMTMLAAEDYNQDAPIYGESVATFMDEDLIALANKVFFIDSNVCNAFGGPVLTLPIPLNKWGINGILTQEVQACLVQHEVPYQLFFDHPDLRC